MKYFCILILIMIAACSKQNDKQLNDVTTSSENVAIKTNEVAEKVNVIDEIQSSMLLEEILMKYMQKEKFESMNDLMPIEYVKKLSEEQKSNYVSFICFMIYDYCNPNSMNTSTDLMKKAYDYMQKSGLFDCLKLTGKSKITSGMVSVIKNQYINKQESPRWSNVIVDIDMGFELLNNISNYMDESNAAYFYSDYAELYRVKGNFDAADLYYLKMAESSNDDAELKQAAMYYRAEMYENEDFEKFEELTIEFLKNADQQYDSYELAMNNLKSAIYFKNEQEYIKEFKKQPNYDPKDEISTYTEKFDEFCNEKTINYITNKLNEKK